AYPEAIAAAAVDSNLQRAAFSNTGSYIDVAAPGAGVTVLWGTGSNTYAVADGTSFASPYVSAEAALVVASNPALSAASVTQIIGSTADDIGTPGVDTSFGHGLIDPRRAVIESIAHPPGWNTKGHGYWTVGIDGSVHTFGAAQFYGDMSHYHLATPV